MTAFAVRSEVGTLRRVLLHRPGLELQRLTPSNCRDLLFDDVLWVKRARQEHDAFADALVERGVEVFYVGDLLAETIKDDHARAWVLDHAIDARDLGADLAGVVRAFLDDADPDTVARHLIGGLTPGEVPGHEPGLKAAVDADRGFLLPPLPNHLFARDTTCWVYDGVSLNPMALPARRRETAHLEAVYRFHPLFAGEDFHVWYGGSDADHRSATIEGGDVHVIGHGAVMIGMGERTTPQAVEALARSLFAHGDSVDTVIAVGLPARRAFMHLDTVMTMVDPQTFVAYPGVVDSMRAWTLRRGDTPDTLVVAPQPDVFTPIKAALGLDAVRVLTTGGDTYEAEREQWDDGNNVLAVAPGVV
ncbi:MAG TPA: arginine deiminase, partial [Acidimicrobiales bacterium]|nr:arginine deiminase [Acidimicrobiales bacterium]